MLTELQSLGTSRSADFASGVPAFPLKYQLGWTSSCLEQLMWKRRESRGPGILNHCGWPWYQLQLWYCAGTFRLAEEKGLETRPVLLMFVTFSFKDSAAGAPSGPWCSSEVVSLLLLWRFSRESWVGLKRKNESLEAL